MADGELSSAKRRARPAERMFALALLGFLTTLSAASADQRAQGRMRDEPPMRVVRVVRGAPPMRFVRVVSADPACAPNCPEWLSAEGRIGPGAAAGLAAAIEGLKGRRLPILIHSPGGSVAEAIAMGELIRAKGLAVAVARTLITNCPEVAPRCANGPGTAITGGAICASACVLALAGGVERLVGPVPLIGVHQITTVVREAEGVAHLMSTRKLYEQQGVDAVVSNYLTSMGVGDPVMALARKTPAASVRWLSLADLKGSHLATSALDAAEPILAGGANGLDGRAFDGDPDLLQASIALPLAGRSATLEIALRFRRGGGVLEAEAIERDIAGRQVADPPAPGWSLTLKSTGVEPLQLRGAGTQSRVVIPRERFCAFARDGEVVAEPVREAPAGAAAEPGPASFALVTMDRAKSLIGEACP
jgi:hypothetical protein